MGLGRGTLLVGRGSLDVIEDRSAAVPGNASIPDFACHERAKSGWWRRGPGLELSRCDEDSTTPAATEDRSLRESHRPSAASLHREATRESRLTAREEQVVDDRDDVDGLILEGLGRRARRLDLGPWHRRRKPRLLEFAAP
jgi:hypothetical protein